MTHDQPKLPGGFKTRAHHNSAGTRQVKSGKTVDQVKAMAKRLGLKYRPRQKGDGGGG